MSTISCSLGLSGFSPLTEALPGPPPPPPPPPSSVTITDLAGNLVELAETITDLSILAPPVYAGSYTLAAGSLLSAPVSLRTPEVSFDGTAITLSQPGLWAYLATGTVPELSYQWQRGGVDIPGATAQTYVIGPADFDQSLQLVETAQSSVGTVQVISAALTMPPDPFSVTTGPDGNLQIDGNDGRSFTIDAAENYYDGTYSVPAGSLSAGPVTLRPGLLSGPANPAPGDTLSLLPPLMAYDPDLGAVAISYAINGTGLVDEAGQTLPSYTVLPADAGLALEITTSATQGQNTVQSVSNTVDIAGAASLSWAQIGTPQSSTAFTATHAFELDLSGYGVGDILVLGIGPADYAASVTLGGVAASPLGQSGGNGGGRLAVFTLTLTGPGSATTPVEVVMPSPNRVVLTSLAVRGGSLDASAFGFDQNRIFSPVSLSGSPAQGTNLVLALACGGIEAFDGPGLSWTGAAQSFASAPLSGGIDGVAIASAVDVSTSGHTVQVEQDTATLGRYGAAALVFSQSG